MAKVTREELEMMEQSIFDNSMLQREPINGLLSQALSDAGVEVEPEPILPGITQGEWEVEEEIGNECWVICIGEVVLGRIYSEADARLIAAAPDAIAVIKRAYDYFNGKSRIVSAPLLDEFRDVLRKAGVKDL